MVKVKPMGQGGLEALFDGSTMAGLRQRGKVHDADGFGFLRYGHSSYGNKTSVGGVYQRRVTGYNNLGRRPGLPRRTYYVRMRYYRPTNPNTAKQQDRRRLFKEAVEGWQGLTTAEKQAYNNKAHGRPLSGYNLYIREKMK